MIASRERLGLLLGFLGMCLFAGTLPATRLALRGLDPLFLTVARGKRVWVSASIGARRRW